VSISKKVGDGTITFFLDRLLVGWIFLEEEFGRLFDLGETKSRVVAEMYALGWVR
jgi:hypothetical protein